MPRPRPLLLLALLVLLPGCDRAESPTTLPADPGELPDRDPGLERLSVSVSPPEPSTRPVPAGVITVAGRALQLPPARLILNPDGSALLTAEAGPDANNLFLLMTPQTDGARPWTRAVWTYRLASPDDETTDGLYVGSPDHHLRPLELTVEILRPQDAPPTLLLRGTLVPADAENPLTAQRFDVSADLPLAIQAP